MENNNWEKEFSKLAMDAEVNPPDEIWNNIEKSMDQAKKGKRMFPGIFLGGLTLLVFVLAFAFRNMIFTTDQTDSLAENSALKSNPHSSPLSHASSKAHMAANFFGMPFETSEKPEMSENSDYFFMNNNAIYHQNSSSDVMSGKSDMTIIQNKNNNLIQSKDKINSTENIENIYKIEGSQKVQTSEIKSEQKINLPRFEGNISTMTATNASNESMGKLQGKSFYPILSSKLLDRATVNCASFKLRKKPFFYTDIEIGVGYTSKLLNFKDIEAREYAGIRNQSENIWYNAGGAVHAGALWSNISLDIGLEFFQINEVFTGNKENETRITINIIEDGMGNVIGRDTVAEVGYREMVSRNTYRQYMIPVRIGYFQSIEKITMGVHFGGAYTISTQTEGVIFDADGSYYDLKSDNKEYFHKDGYWKIIAGLYLGYRAGSGIELFVRPQISLDQRSMDTGNSSVSQSFNNIQCFGGIRYFFH